MSYFKKIKNNPSISEVHYIYGETDNFDSFRGSERWFLSKNAEHFSNDKCLEMDGEFKTGRPINKYIGINKAKYFFNSSSIGAKS